MFAALAYDSVYMVAEASKGAKNSVELKDTLAKLKDFGRCDWYNVNSTRTTTRLNQLLWFAWKMVKSNLLSMLNHNYHLLFVQEAGEWKFLASLFIVRKDGSNVPAISERSNLGECYALLALGYTMVYGIIKLINFMISTW